MAPRGPSMSRPENRLSQRVAPSLHRRSRRFARDQKAVGRRFWHPPQSPAIEHAQIRCRIRHVEKRPTVSIQMLHDPVRDQLSPHRLIQKIVIQARVIDDDAVSPVSQREFVDVQIPDLRRPFRRVLPSAQLRIRRITDVACRLPIMRHDEPCRLLVAAAEIEKSARAIPCFSTHDKADKEDHVSRE